MPTTGTMKGVCALQCNGTNDEKEGFEKDGEGSHHVGIQVHTQNLSERTTPE
jgi:hypothetical protein